MTLLENQIVSLRAPEPEDLNVIHKWENDTSIWHVSNTVEPFSKYILKQYLEQASKDIYEKRQLRLMIDENTHGETVGAIDMFDFDPYHLRAGVGILIDASHREQNYATNALEILKTYAFNGLQLHQLYCTISENNEASLTLFKNAGFTVTGAMKEWIKTPNGWTNDLFLQLINTGTSNR